MTEEITHKDFAKAALHCRWAENAFEEALENLGLEIGRIGWDDYDCSVELRGVDPAARLSEDMQKIVYEAGFCKAYVNHTDLWETHYRFDLKKPFEAHEGWRVRYGHNRDPEAPYIEVESFPEKWPPEWREDGSVKVISPVD